MPRWKSSSRRAAPVYEIAVKQPETFSPPLAMQQAIWDSILNGNFVDAKIFAYSRRSVDRPGRVDTPKALFVNTHVLATAFSYFRSTFDHSDGVETVLTAGLPPGLPTFVDLEEDELDGDYDPAEGVPVMARIPCEETARVLAERPVKAYLVKYTSYRTLRAIIWYIYSRDIVFHPKGPLGSSGVTPKSIYRFADEHGMGDLKKLAFAAITAHSTQLESSRLMEEAFSVFTSRYPEFHAFYFQCIRSAMSSSSSDHAFEHQISRYFSGELPHSKDFLTSLLQTLMSDRPALNIPSSGVGGNNNTIPRVSHPWPVRTKDALCISLDRGTFEDISIMVPLGPEQTKYPVYFAEPVDEGIGLSSLGKSASPQNAETSLVTLRAIAYYMYTDCIEFKPIGLENTELASAHSPADTVFQGYSCSPREVLDVAHRLGTCEELIDLATDAIVSGMTLDNVFGEMFRNPPPPTKIINRGAQIIRENRNDDRIRSQLQKMLEDAVSGDSPAHAVPFSACFIQLFRKQYVFV